jgi:hypothetical protein
LPYGILRKNGTKRYARILHNVKRTTVEMELLSMNSLGSLNKPYRTNPVKKTHTE